MPRFTSKADFSDVDSFFRKTDDMIRAAMEKEGSDFERRAAETGSYRDRTGRMRASCFHRVEGDRLILGNSAEYASCVEARGYSVCSDEVLETRKRLKEAFS